MNSVTGARVGITESDVAPQYKEALKMRRIGVPDRAVRHHMSQLHLDSEKGIAVVFGALDDSTAVQPRALSPTRGADIDESLYTFYSKDINISTKTSLSDLLFRSVLARWGTLAPERAPEPEDWCHVCFEEVPENKLYRKCQLGGAYCSDCVSRFLQADIKEARVSAAGCACLCRSCDTSYGEDEIRQLVSPDVMTKFIKFRNTKLVDANPLMVYCPNRECDSVVTLPSLGASRAKCNDCHTSFCCKCGGQHSRLTLCEWASDSGFRKWKNSTSDGCKRCPNCRLYIEKNSGCSHMSCVSCRHQFCWKCMSPWRSGCSAGNMCTPLSIIRSERWGSVPVLRETTQVVGITSGVGVGIGVAGAVVGLATAAAAVAVGVGIPAAIVGGPMYGAYRGGKKLRKRYLRNKRRGPAGEGTELDHDEHLDIRDEIKWGIRVWINRPQYNYDHVLNFSSDGNIYMGMSGRSVDGVFIAYPDMSSVLHGMSPPLYIIPSDIPSDVVESVAGWSMIDVHCQEELFDRGSTTSLLEYIAADVTKQFTRIGGYASIRRLPVPRKTRSTTRGRRDSAQLDDSLRSLPQEEELSDMLHAIDLDVESMLREAIDIRAGSRAISY